MLFRKGVGVFFWLFKYKYVLSICLCFFVRLIVSLISIYYFLKNIFSNDLLFVL